MQTSLRNTALQCRRSKTYRLYSPLMRPCNFDLSLNELAEDGKRIRKFRADVTAKDSNLQ